MLPERTSLNQASRITPGLVPIRVPGAWLSASDQQRPHTGTQEPLVRGLLFSSPIVGLGICGERHQESGVVEALRHF